MCLGVPGQVVRTWQADGTRMAEVDFGGVTKEVCLAYVPDVVIGDWTIVHVGFALSKLDEQAARETLALFATIGALEAEFGDSDPTRAPDPPPHEGAR
jgi:hydrogenase expression/formation protein HypC